MHSFNKVFNIPFKRKLFHSVQFVLVQGHASHQRLHQLIYRKPEYAVCLIDVIE